MEVREQFNQTQATPLSIEDALELKDELLTKERRENKDLESMLKALEGGNKQAYLNQLTGIKRLIAEVKEVLGYGIEHDYQKHLERLGRMSEQLRTAVENTGTLIVEYRQKEEQTREAYSRNKRLLVLNERIYTGKEQQRAEREGKLAGIEAPSVLGSVNTTEALNLEDEIADLEDDLWKLDIENDDAAVKYTVAHTTHATHRQLRQSLQLLHKDLQKQRSMFDAHCEIARAQEKVVSKLKGVSSASVLYAQAGVLVQQLGEFQEKLQRGLDPVPYDFRITRPAAPTRAQPDGRPYWRSVIAEFQRR